MSKRFDRLIFNQVLDAVTERRARQRFALSRKALTQLLRAQGWPERLAEAEALLPQLNGQSVLDLCQDILEQLSPAPEQGWLPYCRRYAEDLSFPDEDFAPQREAHHDGALFYLTLLQTLLNAARSRGVLAAERDIALLQEQELENLEYGEEYRRFSRAWQQDFVYELMFLSSELTPYRTLEHISGVHQLGLSLARELRAAGEPVDIALISGAAAVHDLGKFGCKNGERVPYLHYYYTDLWCEQRQLSGIGHVGANHSAWDLELENLSAEALLLIYSDFRVKQVRDEQGHEHTQHFTLAEAFEVILHKLDNVDAAKQRRYQFVYAKLRDFEYYMRWLGVDVDRCGKAAPLPDQDIALLSPEQVVAAYKRMSIGHNIELNHRFGAERLFGNILEAARSERDWQNLRAYLGVAEEYFTYLNAPQKLQTLDFLYELLFHREGDIRRQAGALLGAIIAKFNYGYRKELPAHFVPHSNRPEPLQLWQLFLRQIVLPDHKLTAQHKSWIGFSLRVVAATLLEQCPDADRLPYLQAFRELMERPLTQEDFPRFVLLDALSYLPLESCTAELLQYFRDAALEAAMRDSQELRLAALRLLIRLNELPDAAVAAVARAEAAHWSCSKEDSAALAYLQSQLLQAWDMEDSAQRQRLLEPELTADIFLENLKTATPWLVKAVNIQLLADRFGQDGSAKLLHIAAHFSNLIKVSERVVVRHDAGAALLRLAPLLSLDQRNEIAVELAKGLEVGEYEFSKYIPDYLGQFALWLHPRELDELISRLKNQLSNANDSVVAVTLDTVAIVLECYGVYRERFPDSEKSHWEREKYLLGILLKGLSCYRPAVRQEALLVLGRNIFASLRLADTDKRRLFTLSAKKLLFLIAENLEDGLAFYYRAAALNSIYRFITAETACGGTFAFEPEQPIAFFPGTFDPFTLSHKGIMQEIRALGFEVMLAIDQFSWSKNTQPHLLRRQIALQAMADRFHVQMFPDSIPVNLANPEDLKRLRSLFPGRDVYIVVGSDVVANASSYRAAPTENSIHSFDHIIFLRSANESGEATEQQDLSAIQGRIIRLALPMHLEDISSTRIRENIDHNRDVSNLLDPMVQEYIYHHGIYLREPQYKPIMRAGAIHFELVGPELPGRIRAVTEQVVEQQPLAGLICDELIHRNDQLIVIRNRDADDRAEGFISFGRRQSSELLAELGSAALAERIRSRAYGSVFVISSLVLRRPGSLHEREQLLLTEALDWALRHDCIFALFHGLPQLPLNAEVNAVLERQGFIRPAADHPLWAVDMHAPLTLIQNLETTVKEPLASRERVLETIRSAHQQLQSTLVTLFPGQLVLSMSSGVIHHRLVDMITSLNGVPAQPLTPRRIGPYMCVPFGKLLRGKAAPNTVTKTLHTDKVFAPDLRSFTIEAYPGYSPLPDQIRTIKSFMRPVIMVDDLLHKGYRIRALKPLLDAEHIEVKTVLAGIVSGRGLDFVQEAGLSADSVYYVPNMRGWFVESSMYPFIGGDTVRRAVRKAPGLLPSVNLILPYAAPPLHQYYDRAQAFALSLTCLSNARDIMLALEAEYRLLFGRNLTLSRLPEAIIRPLCPDRGGCVDYEANLAASVYLQNDIEMLLRTEQVIK